MDDDQAICRVCRGNSSISHPLFYPCKCSGSIRFVHQDCLLQWLSLSKKKYCELCEHPFVFTPIYRDDMPDKIPVNVLLGQCIRRFLNGCVTSMRFILVVVVWFILLPTLTVWTWRFYFWSGEGFTNSLNQTRYSLKVFISDCISGQIITAVVVIVFVAAYLFREWVIKNTAHITQPQVNNDRIEELRRELERRRQNVNYNDTLEYNNPYSANIAGYHQMARHDQHNNNQSDNDDNYDDDDSDEYMFHRPASGTQSPFASWRDYQQDTGKSQLQHEIIADDTSANTGTWKASEFGESSKTDYFSEPITEEEPHGSIEEETHVEPVEETHVEPVEEPAVEPAVPNLEEPFDFIENLDNVLEAIGMRGNLFMLPKNSILMSLMINLCLCVTVWIPYIIGRSFILIRPNSLITKPIYMLRLLSDPVIDLLLDNILRVYNNFEMICGYVLPTSILTTIKAIHGDIQSGLYYIVKSIHITLHDNGGGSLSQLLSETTSNILDRTNTIQNWKLIQSNIYSISVIIFKRLRQCATDQGSLDRVVCTAVGYMILISIGSWYLSKNKNTNGSTNEILRQQGVFLKVLFFIFLELIIFPTVCGVLLDISTLPLFTEYTIKSRFHFVLLNPYSGVFLHWFIGTGFIFNFSVFVALVREVVRPGVLFFVPDPNDSQFHPVQDIVDQPILVLLRHLFTITATYFMLILVGMGFVTFLVSKYGGIYPIIWKFDIPISSLPIDLLAVQFLLPPIMSYIVPREFCKKSVTTWWHIVSRQLRLSSYMFGGRYPKEEIGDGGLVRVPTHDNVPIVVPRRRMIVPVDTVTLQPLLASEQNLRHPAISQSEERDTTIVYVPSLFYYRITVFLFLIWTTGSVLVCSISVVPLKLGRNIFAMGPDRPVHDLYSFALGSYIMIVMSSFLNTIVQKYQLLRADDGTIIWSLVKQYLLNKAHKAITFAYLVIVCGFVLPFLVGVIMDLYIFMPLRLSNIDQNTLHIYVTFDWAIGLAVLSLFYGVVNILPSHASFRETIIQFNWNNLANLDIIQTSKKTIFPAILSLCFSIIFPSILTVAAIRLLDINDADVKILIFRCAYPLVFCFVCLIFILNAIISLIDIWLRTIRDDTYLIGKQLHNLNENAL